LECGNPNAISKAGQEVDPPLRVFQALRLAVYFNSFFLHREGGMP